MCAPGAIAWAHCTSRLISSAQPGSTAGGFPNESTSTTLLKQPLHVRPYCASNAMRSLMTVGSSYASTIAIVLPAPAVGEVGNPYTDWIAVTPRPVGDGDASGVTPSPRCRKCAKHCASPAPAAPQTERSLWPKP